MADLLGCVKIAKCSPMKKGLFTHVWIDISLNPSSTFLRNGLMIKRKEIIWITMNMHVGRMIYRNRSVLVISKIQISLSSSK